jgi:pentatricopeptide repeat protein
VSGSLGEARRDGGGSMFQRQLQLFDRMETDGIMPVKKTYHILIQSAKHAGNLQMAEYFFQKYRNTGCEPTVRAPLYVGDPAWRACIPLSGHAHTAGPRRGRQHCRDVSQHFFGVPVY